MDEHLRPRQIKLHIHGCADTNRRVRGSVLARQLAALVSALQSADRVVNGGVRFDYVIEDMKKKSAIVLLHEFRSSKKAHLEFASEALVSAVDGVVAGNKVAIHRFGDCLSALDTLGRGAEKEYSHTDLVINGYKPFRIDEFFCKKVQSAIAVIKEDALTYYAGVAVGSFDGIIKAVDHREQTAKLILTLSAGGREIDCTYDATADELRNVLDRRVVLEGRAHYDGTSGLPKRIEIVGTPTPVKEGRDFLRWQGKFQGMEPIRWDEPE